MGEERKTDVETPFKGQTFTAGKKKPLLVPLFKMNRRVFALFFFFFFKEGFSSGSETKIKKSRWRLESSTLPCVSFRALECLNQSRRQLEAVGDELQGGSLQSPPGELWTDLFICGKVMTFSYFYSCSSAPHQRENTSTSPFDRTSSLHSLHLIISS